MYGCYGKMNRMVINYSGEGRQGRLLARST